MCGSECERTIDNDKQRSVASNYDSNPLPHKHTTSTIRTLLVVHPPNSPLNAAAPKNIPRKVVTLLVVHLDTSPLNVAAFAFVTEFSFIVPASFRFVENASAMVVIALVSHSAMSPHLCVAVVASWTQSHEATMNSEFVS